ncbi:MAG: GGDEF domain-containing protein [Candidatus Thiodiazotropha sp.]
MPSHPCFQLDTPEQAREWHEKAIHVLDQHQIPPAPVCHLIAYQYVSGRDETLNQRIDQKIANQAAIDGHLFRHLFEELYLDESGPQQMDDHLSDLHHLLYQVLQGVTAACSHTELFDETLRQQSEALNGNPNVEDLRAIAGKLLEATTRSIHNNRLMQEQLHSVEQQTQHLQDEVRKLRDEASTDPLTGLYNRKALSQRMQSLLESAENSESNCFSVLMLDIDHFKRFNDTYGHIIGDEVIRRVGKTMRELLRDEDFPARYGGEEFTVVLPSTRMDTAVEIAQRIHQAVAKLSLVRRSTKERLPGITISVGAAQSRSGDSCDTLLERADQALYLAKEGGRNRVVSEAQINYM